MVEQALTRSSSYPGHSVQNFDRNHWVQFRVRGYFRQQGASLLVLIRFWSGSVFGSGSAQDVQQRVGSNPTRAGPGRGPGLGPAGGPVPEPGLLGPEGGVPAERNRLPGPALPGRTRLSGLQGAGPTQRQDPGRGVAPAHGKNRNRNRAGSRGRVGDAALL